MKMKAGQSFLNTVKEAHGEKLKALNTFIKEKEVQKVNK